MSFTYRSPVENVLSKFTSEEQSTISTFALHKLREIEKENSSFFNFDLPEEAKQKFIKAGIYLSPFSFVPHSHPCCKTLENHLLLNVLPNYIDNTFYIVSMKDSKIKYLRNRSKCSTLKALNRYVVGKDINRYGSDFYFSEAKKKIPPTYDGIVSETLTDLVPLALTAKARRILLHDELHCWSMRDLDNFLCAVKPEIIVATHVFPKEILIGQKKSVNEWLYTFELINGTLIFNPDGKTEEAYEQPLSSGTFLKLKHFTTSSGELYTITLVYSIFSHSVLQISRGKLISESFRTFSGFDASMSTEMNEFGGAIGEVFPVRPEIVLKIYLYLKTLKKPDVESGLAKLRQAVPNPTGFEIAFIDSFASLVLNYATPKNLIEEYMINYIRDKFIDLFPPFIKRQFKSFGGRNLESAIMCIAELKVKIKCFDLKASEMHLIDSFPKFLNSDELKRIDLMNSTDFDFVQPNSRCVEVEKERISQSLKKKEDSFLNSKGFKMEKKSWFNSGLGLCCENISSISDSFSKTEILKFAIQTVYSIPFEYYIQSFKKLQNFIYKKEGNLFLPNVDERRMSRIFLSGTSQTDILLNELMRLLRIEINHLTHAKRSKNGIKLLCFEPFSEIESRVMNIKRRQGIGANPFFSFENLMNDVIDELSKESCLSIEGLSSLPFIKIGTAKTFDSYMKSECVVPVEENETKTNGDMVNELFDQSYVSMLNDLIHNEDTNIDSTPQSSLDELREKEEAIEDEKNEALKIELEKFSRLKYKCYERFEDFSFSDLNNFNLFKVEGDGDCFWHCITYIMGGDVKRVKDVCIEYAFAEKFNLDFINQMVEKVYAEDESAFLVSSTFGMKINIYDAVNNKKRIFNPVSCDNIEITMYYNGNHFDLMIPKEGCVVRAVSKSLGRDEIDILKVLSRNENRDILDELNLGNGLPHHMLERVFTIFGINATLSFNELLIDMNPKGSLKRNFILKDGHLELNEQSVEIIGRKDLISDGSDIKGLCLEISSGNSVECEISMDRALRTQNSFLEGYSGKILSTLFGNQKKWIEGEVNDKKFTAWLVIGTFGSGKSYSIKRVVKKKRNNNFVIISPRRLLADNFKEELGIAKSWKKGEKSNVDVITFESALKRKVKDNSIVIFDEMQLFPPGYLDLFMAFNKKIKDVIILGDPAQSSYDSEKDREIFSGVENDLVNILNDKEYQYVIKSRRFKNSFFNGRLPCVMENIKNFESDTYTFFDNVRDNYEQIASYDVILCASFPEVNQMKYIFRGKLQVMTFGQATGLTFRKGAILISQNVRNTDEKRILVALSRFSENIGLINQTGEDLKEFILSMSNSCLYRFCAQKANIDDLKGLLPGKPILIEERKKIGSDDVDREERLSGDPWLKTHIFLGKRPVNDADYVTNVLEELRESKPKTHHPCTGQNIIHCNVFDKMRLREAREVRVGTEISEQFRDEYFCKDRKKVSNQCDLFESIYPRHKSTDSVTFLMAVKKRLSFSDENANAKSMKRNEGVGCIMFDVFTKRIKMDPRINHEMLAEATNDFEVKKLEKSIATIENHSGRSNRDWDIKEAFVFMKSQLCTKFEKRFCDAKAGQTLACFSHIVLCRFAPWIRYIEKKVLEVLPKNYYIHSGKNFDQLKDWVISQDFSGECTESDYEAFDASQDSSILVFEIKIMKFLGIPLDVIEDYKFIKLNLRSKLGVFSVMRFTGEAGTFLFNTLSNMCFTFMRYNLNGSESIAFAGDDMCANVKLKRSELFSPTLDKLKLKAKIDYKSEASFCGWTLGSFGIYKKPQLVLERFLISEERDTLRECIDNYAIEVSYGYRLGDEVFQFMSEEEIDCQHECIRFIVHHANMIRSDALKYFNGSLKDFK